MKKYKYHKASRSQIFVFEVWVLFLFFEKGGMQLNDEQMEFLNKSSRINNYSVIPNGIYGMNISSTAMVLYAKLLNRAQLSVTNNYVDELGRAYVIYTLEDLARELNKSVSSIKANMNELVAAGLVEKRRSDRGRANIIFVKVPASSIASSKAGSYRSENNLSISSKVVSYRGGKLTANNNNKKQNISTKYLYEKGLTL